MANKLISFSDDALIAGQQKKDKEHSLDYCCGEGSINLF
jgi:hypothetical protein